MIFTKPHGPEDKDRVFIHCSNGRGSSLTIARGAVVIMDTSAQAASLGELGYRVTTSATLGDVRYAGIAEQLMPTHDVTKPGQPRLVQVYGYHDAVLMNNGTGGVVAAGAGYLTTSTAPAISELEDDISLYTNPQVVGIFGYNLASVNTGAQTGPAFIKGM